jgi:serine/threonine-protein kinase RIO1
MKKKMTIVELFLDGILKSYRQFISEGIFIPNPHMIKLNGLAMEYIGNNNMGLLNMLLQSSEKTNARIFDRAIRKVDRKETSKT